MFTRPLFSPPTHKKKSGEKSGLAMRDYNKLQTQNGQTLPENKHPIPWSIHSSQAIVFSNHCGPSRISYWPTFSCKSTLHERFFTSVSYDLFHFTVSCAKITWIRCHLVSRGQTLFFSAPGARFAGKKRVWPRETIVILLLLLVIVCKTSKECGCTTQIQRCKVQNYKVWCVKLLKYNYSAWLCNTVLNWCREDLFTKSWSKLFQILIVDGKKEYRWLFTLE